MSHTHSVQQTFLFNSQPFPLVVGFLKIRIPGRTEEVIPRTKLLRRLHRRPVLVAAAGAAGAKCPALRGLRPLRPRCASQLCQACSSFLAAFCGFSRQLWACGSILTRKISGENGGAELESLLHLCTTRETWGFGLGSAVGEELRQSHREPKAAALLAELLAQLAGPCSLLRGQMCLIFRVGTLFRLD